MHRLFLANPFIGKTAPIEGASVETMMAKKETAKAARTLVQLDARTSAFFAPYADSPVVRLLGIFSKLGDQPELRLMTGSLMLAGTLASSDRLVRAGACALIAHEAATLVKDLIKTDIDRTRPRSAKRRDQQKLKKGPHTAKEMTSFPSGHSAGAIAAALSVAREFPEHRAALVSLAAFICLSQVVRCAHYPTDVAAGISIGLASDALVNFFWASAQMDERSVT